MSAALHTIVIVGGGAGGVELACRLGRSVGRRKQARVVLVDQHRTHVWKPLFHEVAAGSLNADVHLHAYAAIALANHFQFKLGRMQGMDRAARTITLEPLLDEQKREILPAREVKYDSLVLAVGSQVNFFGVTGAQLYSYALDNAIESEAFHRRLIDLCLSADAADAADRRIEIAIVGAGATGVELAAELTKCTRMLAAYGFDHFEPQRDFHITLIEASERILPPLREKVAKAAHALLEGLGVQVRVNERVVEVRPDALVTATGEVLPATLTVWAAGIQAPPFLREATGLTTNRTGQLMVTSTLGSPDDENIFAIGDCANVPWLGKDIAVPPRAQSAHQAAKTLAQTLARRVNGEPPVEFRFHDYGSLVSLADYSAVGSLMGKLIGKSLFVEGLVARIMYMSLYKSHLLTLHGPVKVVLDVVSDFLRQRTEPRVKLH